MQAEPQDLHTGHRKRMLDSFFTAGLEGFSDVETLELLLSYAIPRRDVNPLAHALLREFGSLHRVLEAPLSQLTRVPGIGVRTAALLRLAYELRGRCDRSRTESRRVFHNTGEIGDYLLSRAGGLREERAWLLCLDGACRFIECRELCRGAVNSVNLPYRKLVEAALLANATSVVLAHNHTAGLLIPSLADMEYTREARRTLALMDVTLSDHILLGDHGYVSMKASNMMLD